MYLQNNASFISEEYDNAVLKAFLVFIAYSNVVNNSKKTKFDMITFIGKVFKLIRKHDD